MTLPALVSGLDREWCPSERQLPCRFPFPRGASLFSAVTLRGRWVRGVVREREASSSTEPTAPPTTRAAFAHPLRAAFVLEPCRRGRGWAQEQQRRRRQTTDKDDTQRTRTTKQDNKTGDRRRPEQTTKETDEDKQRQTRKDNSSTADGSGRRMAEAVRSGP